MFTSLCILSGIAAIACTLINRDHDNDEIIYDIDDSIMYNNTKEDYEQETFDYFMGLRLEDQERYFNENAYLRYWKDNNHRGLTNDTYTNAKHAREIARLEGMKFTDIYKTY